MSENQLLQHVTDYKYTALIESTGERVSFRPITTGQMKGLLTYEDSKDTFIVETMMDELITSCVTDKDFNIDDITLQDRFDLLLEIRKKTKGSIYTFNIRCPDCGTTSINNVKLDELEYKEFKPNIDPVIKINDTLSIRLDYIRRGDQKKAIKIVNTMKGLSDRQQIVEIATYTYALCMKEFITPTGVMEKPSIKDIVEFLDSFDEDMYSVLIDWFKDSDYGVEFEYELKCSNCDFSEVKNIPVSSFLA